MTKIGIHILCIFSFYIIFLVIIFDIYKIVHPSWMSFLMVLYHRLSLGDVDTWIKLVKWVVLFRMRNLIYKVPYNLQDTLQFTEYIVLMLMQACDIGRMCMWSKSSRLAANWQALQFRFCWWLTFSVSVGDLCTLLIVTWSLYVLTPPISPWATNKLKN